MLENSIKLFLKFLNIFCLETSEKYHVSGGKPSR